MKVLFMKSTQTNRELQPFMVKWLQCLIFSNMSGSLYRQINVHMYCRRHIWFPLVHKQRDQNHFGSTG